MARPVSAATASQRMITARVKGQFFDRAKVRRMLERANYEALRKAGMDVRQAAKRGIGQATPARTKAGQKQVRAGAVVEFAGGLYRDLTMMGSGKPRPAGKPAKSWGPKRFLYRDIMYYWDDTRKSVVIGSLKADWLARLHEFGGSLTLTAYRIGTRAAKQALVEKQARGNGGRDARGRFLARAVVTRKHEYGAILWSHKGFRGMRNWEKTSLTKNARYPARPFMQGSASVQKVLARIALRFRDTIRRAA